MKAVLSSKGEVLIPNSLLERYGLSAAATVVLEPREGEIVLRPDIEPSRARRVKQDNDVLLEAGPNAPPMTPENVKQL
jgi:bifunctional DNA-binding transcriptional regulator/antitoxin component of YhaV-PrlF toxin-antitoxin module